MLHVTLLYSTLPPSFSLFRFLFLPCYILALHYFTALYFALCFAFLILFSSLVYFVRALYLSTPSLSLWFILPYFALFSFHYIPVCFALLRFFTLPSLRFTSFRLAFLIFLGPVSSSGFNLISSRGHRASFHSLLNLLRWASRHSTPPYSALLRLAWTPGFGEIRAGLTALCNLLAVQERNEAPGRPSDFTQCILIADLTLRRLVSKINLENQPNAKSRSQRDETERETPQWRSFLLSVALSPHSLLLLFSTFLTIFFRDSF